MNFIKNRIFRIALAFLSFSLYFNFANAQGNLTEFTVDIDKPKIQSEWTNNKSSLTNNSFNDLTSGNFIRPYFAVEITVNQTGQFTLGNNRAPMDTIGILYNIETFDPINNPAGGFIAYKDDDFYSFLANPSFTDDIYSPTLSEAQIEFPDGVQVTSYLCGTNYARCPIIGGYQEQWNDETQSSTYQYQPIQLEAGRKYVLMISRYSGTTNRMTADANNLEFGSSDYNVFCYGVSGICNINYFVYSSPTDTLASMRPNAEALSSAFNRQYASLAYGLNHDCTLFDVNNICMSVYGRNTTMSASSYDSSAAGLVLAYKPSEDFRIGSYVDQTLSNDSNDGVKVDRSNPDLGIFGVWNSNKDGSGLQVRVAANYGKRDIQVSRTAVGTAEAGTGKSDIKAYGAMFEMSYSLPVAGGWVTQPYAGIRYISIKRDAYSENANDMVFNPLTFSNVQQKSTTGLIGVRMIGQLSPKLVTMFNLGLEQDINNNIDDYRASGVVGLTPISMLNSENSSRPTAGAIASYDVAEKQRLTASVQYRKEVYMLESSTTGQVTYTIGF